MLLTPDVTVYVHEIDTAAHPSIQPGWRWSVVVGGRPATDHEHTVGAGWSPDESAARLVGEMVGAAVVLGARTFGVPVGAMPTIRLSYDPIPAGADRLHILT